MHDAETWIPIEDPILPAALAALGFTVRPKVHLYANSPTQSANKSASWLVGNHSVGCKNTASELIPSWRSGEIRQTAPEHPLVVAMMALQTRVILGQWRRCVHGMPHVVKLPGANLARAVAPSSRTQSADLAAFLPGSSTVMHSLDHAAAAITVGHGIKAMTAGGCAITERCAFSQTLTAGQLAAAAAAIDRDARQSAIVRLDNLPAGEHPFLYALAAIMHGRALQQIVDKADPIVHQNGRHGKAALVSLSILDGNTNFREEVYRHLK